MVFKFFNDLESNKPSGTFCDILELFQAIYTSDEILLKWDASSTSHVTIGP